MADPVTIGGVAALVLSIASEEALKSTVGEAVKDGYKALKERIAHWAAADVDALERNPRSTARRAVIAEAVDALPERDQTVVRALADELADALEKNAAAGPVGFDIGTLEAARVKLGKVSVNEGIGLRAKEVRASGDFEVSELNVGRPPGKAEQ